MRTVQSRVMTRRYIVYTFSYKLYSGERYREATVSRADEGTHRHRHIAEGGVLPEGVAVCADRITRCRARKGYLRRISGGVTHVVNEESLRAIHKCRENDRRR